jgi:phosphonate transport system substrate-binding protein
VVSLGRILKQMTVPEMCVCQGKPSRQLGCGPHRQALALYSSWLRPAMLVAWIGLVLSTSCDSRDYKAVSLQSGAPLGQSKMEPKAALRVGLAPILSARSGGEGLVSLCRAVSQRLERPVTPLLGSDYREINDMLAMRQLDVGIVCSGAFADPRLDRVCEPLLVPLLDGAGSMYESYLIVRAKNPAHRLEDLEGRDFVFTDTLSLTGFIHPTSRLCAMGRTPESFFSGVSFSHSHDRSIAMVADGSATAAAVDSAVFHMWQEHHPTEARNLRILEKSEFFPAPPIVVQTSLSAQDKFALRKALLELAESGEGKLILKKIGWTGFKVPDAEYLRRLDKLRKLYGKLRGQNRLPA